jgi:hypothetical protein
VLDEGPLTGQNMKLLQGPCILHVTVALYKGFWAHGFVGFDYQDSMAGF